MNYFCHGCCTDSQGQQSDNGCRSQLIYMNFRLGCSIEIRLGDSRDHRDNPMCQWLQIKNGDEVSFDCQETGRYLSFSSATRNLKSLGICTVKAMSHHGFSSNLCSSNLKKSPAFVLNGKCHVAPQEPVSSINFNFIVFI